MPPGCGGALRPEKRVTAWSKLPQKKWAGLTLPRKPRAELLEHPIGLQQDAPEALRKVRIVGGVLAVLAERDRLRHLVGAAMDPHPEVELGQRRHEPVVERRRPSAARAPAVARRRRWSGSAARDR